MMIKELIKYFENKKVLILGCGREGISTYKLIRKYLKNQEIYIADAKQDFQKDYEIFDGDENVHFISGEMYLEGLENYDVIMKTPGISFAGIDTSKYVHKIKSQLELLLEFFDVTTIGITGGKVLRLLLFIICFKSRVLDRCYLEILVCQFLILLKR